MLRKLEKKYLQKIESLTNNPEIHSPDKYKQNNDGSYRAFELHRYRIAIMQEIQKYEY